MRGNRKKREELINIKDLVLSNEFNSSFFNLYQFKNKRERNNRERQIKHLLTMGYQNQSLRKIMSLKSIYCFCHYYEIESQINNYSKDHFEFMESVETYKRVLVASYRGFSKTSIILAWVKMKLLSHNSNSKNIVDSSFSKEYGKQNIWWCSKDYNAALSNTTKIANSLQGNKKIIQDFGRLWKDGKIFDEDVGELDSSLKYSKGKFDTGNGVSVTAAVSMGDTMRGQTAGLRELVRPDLVILDDFQQSGMTNLEKEKTNLFIDTMIGGQTQNLQIIVLMNRSTFNGPGDYIEKKFKALGPGKAKVLDFPVMTLNDKGEYDISWPDRFKMTDKEVEDELVKIKKEIDKLKNDVNCPRIKIERLQSRLTNGFQSIESLKKELGKKFDQEMMNVPYVSGGRYFETDIIDLYINNANKFEKYDNSEIDKRFEGNFNWSFYEERGRMKNGKNKQYLLGCDVSDGIGRDSSTIIVYNSTDRSVAAVFESNEYNFKDFSKEIMKASDYFYNADIVIESNNHGVAVIEILNNLHSGEYGDRIIFDYEQDRIRNVTRKKYWTTNRKTKPLMLLKAKELIEGGLVRILDLTLLNELKTYSKEDSTTQGTEGYESGHYDVLMGFCIALYNSELYHDTGISTVQIKSIRDRNKREEYTKNLTKTINKTKMRNSFNDNEKTKEGYGSFTEEEVLEMNKGIRRSSIKENNEDDNGIIKFKKLDEYSDVILDRKTYEEELEEEKRVLDYFYRRR